MKKFLLSLFLVFFTTNAYTADVTIEMLNKNKETKKRMVYSQELVKIEVGQSIEWVPTAKAHNVEMLIGPEGYELPKKSKLSKPVTLTFTTPGIYLYQCSPHAALGMIGIIVVGGDTSNMEQVAKKKLTGSKSKKKRDKLLKEI
jgi:pseudoazurin